MMSFWAYILHCADRSYYTGHTEDLDVRLAQHQRGEIKGFTQRKRPVTLVWTETFPTRDEALAAELHGSEVRFSVADESSLVSGLIRQHAEVRRRQLV